MVSTIFVINLDKRPDRYNAVLQQIKASDLKNTPSHRISAFDGKNNDFTYLLSPKAKEELQSLKTKGYRDHHAQLSPAAIGCYLSHFETWKTIAQMDAPGSAVFLILEDDATVPKDALKNIEKGLHTLETSGYNKTSPFILLWELICLEGCKVPKNNLFKPDAFWSLQAYSVTADTAKKLIEMPFFPIENQLDTELLFPRDARMLNIFAYPFFKNLSRDSDIQIKAHDDAPLRRAEKGMETIKYPPLLGHIGQGGGGEHLVPEAEVVVVTKTTTSKPMVIGLISVSVVVVILFIVLIVMLSARKR